MTPVAVAVVGVAGRFARASSAQAFYQDLALGRSLIRTVNGGQPQGGPLAGFVPVSASLADPLVFDHDRFAISYREACAMDPQQRLLITQAQDALIDAGISDSTLRTGVYASASMSTYLTQHLLTLPAAQRPAAYAMLLGNDKDFVALRTAHALNLTGPAMTVSSACSGSLVAAHLACLGLLAGDCDVALVGGVSVSFPAGGGYWAGEVPISSPTGQCRPFDHQADGTVKGDGVGVVALMVAEEAYRRGMGTYATILGSAVGNDGATKSTFAAPSPDGQARTIATAWDYARATSVDAGYIEAHGTGTVLGDPLEVEGLRRGLGAGRGAGIAIGSLKANVGHLDAAAGVASLIKVALMRHYSTIGPQINFERPNPHLDLDEAGLVVPLTRQRWPEHRPLAGISAFGIGGTNAHLVIGPAPHKHRHGPTFDPPTPHKKNAPACLWPPTPPSTSPVAKAAPTTDGAPALADVTTLFGAHTGAPIQAGTNFFDAGGDSLAAVELADEIRRAWAPGFTLAAFESDPTPLGVYRALSTGAGGPTLAWITRPRSGPTRTFVFIHPAGGSIACYRSLARFAGDSWQIAAIAYPYAGPGPDHTIATLADLYAPVVDGSTSGPLSVGGYSLGGNIAHEILARHPGLGARVEQLALIDSLPSTCYPLRAPSGAALRAAASAAAKGAGLRELSSRAARTWAATARMLYGYEPSALVDTPLTWLRARTREHPALVAAGVTGGEHSWDAWATSVRVVDVTGDHYSVMGEHVGEVASALGLTAAGAGGSG